MRLLHILIFSFLLSPSFGSSQILEPVKWTFSKKQISDKMYEAFDRLLQLEAKECATTGFTFNIFSSYRELIRNSVGITKIFYETKLLHLKTQVQEIQKND